MCFRLIFIENGGSGVIWKPALAFILFCLNMALVGIVGVVIKNKIYLALFLIFSHLGYLFFFANTVLGALGFVALFVASWFWVHRAKKDLKNRIRPVIARSLNFGLRFAVSIFLLVVAFGFYWQAQTVVTSQVMMERLEDIEVSLLGKALSTQIKDFDPEMDFESFVYKASQSGVAGRSLVGGIKSDQITPTVLEQIRQNYVQRFEVNISFGDSVENILRKVIRANLTVALEKYSRFFPFALAIVLFLVLKLFSLLYYIFIRIFALGLYHLFLSVGLFKHEVESLEVKRINIG